MGNFPNLSQNTLLFLYEDAILKSRLLHFFKKTTRLHWVFMAVQAFFSCGE